MSQKMSEYSAPRVSNRTQLIGGSGDVIEIDIQIDIKSQGEIEAQYFVSKMHCDQFEPRIFEKLESLQLESTDVLEIDLDDVPCYIDFFKLLKEGMRPITLEKSGDFLKTCEYFGATQLANNVKNYFGQIVPPNEGPKGNISN